MIRMKTLLLTLASILVVIGFIGYVVWVVDIVYNIVKTLLNN